MNDNQAISEGLLASTMGIKKIAVDKERAVYEISTNTINKNPYGVIHGGVIYTAIDYSMGSVVWKSLRENEVCATVEIAIKYLKPTFNDSLKIETHLLQRGSRLAFLESKTTNSHDEIVAIANGTFAISIRR